MKRFLSLLLSCCLGIALFQPAAAGPVYSSGRTASSASSVRSDLMPADNITTVIVTLKDGCPAPHLNDPHITVTYEDEAFIILDYKGSSAECNLFLKEIVSDESVQSAEYDTLLAASSLSGKTVTPSPAPVRPSLVHADTTGAPGPRTNDAFAASQYWFNNTGYYEKFSSSGTTVIASASDIDIDGPEGWAAFKDAAPSRPVVVAIIDTGIDHRHPDLADSMWINKNEIPDNGVDDDKNGYIDDIYGWDFYNDDATVCHYEYNEEHGAELCSPSDNDNHGTHCAGIIAAKADNSIGIAGVASVGNVRLMSLKVYGGAECNGSVAGAIKAIRYADRMGADVCNISWGFYSYSSSLYTAISRSNMLFICAAGNDGSDNDVNPIYPASYDLSNVISVGYLTEHGKMASGSNYGKNTVEVAVPAKDIFSTIVGSYASMNGSSMAAPQVSGIAALLYSFGDGMYASNVKDIIIKSIKPVSQLDEKTITGGIPSLAKALAASSDIRYDLENPSMQIGLKYSKDELLVRFTTEDADGSDVSNLRYFTGERSLDYFAHGTEGTAVADNELVLSKPGKYTFFLSDYAGNEIVRTLMIPDDMLSPVISDISLSVNNKMTKLTVSANVRDDHSGIRTVKYLAGIHSASDFLAGNINELTPDEDGRISFTTKEEGPYTIYAADGRGNTRVVTVYAYIRKAVSITLNKSSLSVTEGKTKRLKPTLTPSTSTDRIKYTSSDESIAEVSSTGVVTGIAPGECTVTLKTSSGKTTTCKIKVKPKKQ